MLRNMSRKPSPLLEPASTIIGKFGGAIALADMLGVDVSNVHRWTYPKTKKGGTGGRIPPHHWKSLLDHARARRIRLKLEDFLEAA